VVRGDAVAWLRRHDEDYAAELAETGGVAAGLMNTDGFPNSMISSPPWRFAIAPRVRGPCSMWR